VKLIVWQIIGDFDVKYGRRVGEKYTRVAFKPLDDTGMKVHYLNLPHKFIKYEEWIKYLKPGNILDVSLQGNKKNVNYFMNFSVVKEVDGVTYERSVEE
jgi:hypothetical protein